MTSNLCTEAIIMLQNVSLFINPNSFSPEKGKSNDFLIKETGFIHQYLHDVSSIQFLSFQLINVIFIFSNLHSKVSHVLMALLEQDNAV